MVIEIVDLPIKISIVLLFYQRVVQRITNGNQPTKHNYKMGTPSSKLVFITP